MSSPATSVCLLLHPDGRDRRRRASNSHSSAGVDYGDGITGAKGGRLVYLHLMIIIVGLEAGRRVVIIRGGRQREVRHDLLRWLNLVL